MPGERIAQHEMTTLCPLARLGQHGFGTVDTDDDGLREALAQDGGDIARTAAEVDHTCCRCKGQLRQQIESRTQPLVGERRYCIGSRIA